MSCEGLIVLSEEKENQVSNRNTVTFDDDERNDLPSISSKIIIEYYIILEVKPIR